MCWFGFAAASEECGGGQDGEQGSPHGIPVSLGGRYRVFQSETVMVVVPSQGLSGRLLWMRYGATDQQP